MSRSRKKVSCFTISKPWDRLKEKALRSKVKQACHEAEIDWDPDRDWVELYITNRSGADWGTKLGYPYEPHPDDSIWEREWKDNWFLQGKRK